MNIYHILLKSLHKIYVKLYTKPFVLAKDIPGIIMDPDEASKKIFLLLDDDKPCMIARFGSTELQNVNNYKSITASHHSLWKYIINKEREWWWNEKNCQHMMTHSGFFPNTKENLCKFGELMCKDSIELDLLGSWISEELFASDIIPKHTIRIPLMHLEPFWATKPWTRVLKGKRIVVVHPFAELIEAQYNYHRTELFENEDILPPFKLRTVKAVQSLGGENKDFYDWFEALNWMKSEVCKEDFDIALIGCGAYGFPLAAHIKRYGKKAIHLGGALQLLFGIRGNRWDDPLYGVKEWNIPAGSYSSLPNENWVRPSAEMKPRTANNVEGGCYW